MVVTLDQQYNTGEEPSVMLYTYINRHAGTPDKNRNKTVVYCIPILSGKTKNNVFPGFVKFSWNVLNLFYFFKPPPKIQICLVSRVETSLGVVSGVWRNTIIRRSTPVAQSAPRNLLTRWDVSSIPANGVFLTKN